ncbi:MAG: hypothetical protein DCF15_19830 [Phormidesmis priestleyi]|uniref:Uncharacterized protein n=1 Tax=Phormidesmis priestleyi TaxID=268141 RepID=A0A2W4YI09_9CYAN|nr:MAG: hypothetical protein DCF15_19830 [Phormidesmis priestleyi]
MSFLFRSARRQWGHTCVIGLSCGAALFSPLWGTNAIAQSVLPACPPPVNGEYLLLVRGETESDRAQIAAALPAENPVLVCTYLNEPLVRAGGFTSLETANAWATYMTTEAGFESFVSKPSDTQTAIATTNNPAAPVAATTSARSSASGAISYQPRRLSDGYAVLVDYGDRPDVATAVGQVVTPVGLAVYQQRAYLLADYTADAAGAATTLQKLSDAQLAPILVDAQQVVRISTEVAR